MRKTMLNFVLLPLAVVYTVPGRLWLFPLDGLMMMMMKGGKTTSQEPGGFWSKKDT